MGLGHGLASSTFHEEVIVDSNKRNKYYWVSLFVENGLAEKATT